MTFCNVVYHLVLYGQEHTAATQPLARTKVSTVEELKKALKRAFVCLFYMAIMNLSIVNKGKLTYWKNKGIELHFENRPFKRDDIQSTLHHENRYCISNVFLILITIINQLSKMRLDESNYDDKLHFERAYMYKIHYDMKTRVYLHTHKGKGSSAKSNLKLFNESHSNETQLLRLKAGADRWQWPSLWV